MTYDPLATVAYGDGPNLDAFARLRVSQPTLLLDSKQVGGTPDLLATTSVSGSGAVAYQIDRASTYLTVGAAAGTAIRQTKSRAIYQPGKSLLGFITFVMPAAQTNLRGRVGYFDGKNGIFLQRDGSTLSIVTRSYVSGAAVDTVVTQANWNRDKLNGSGPSGYTLDVTKANILMLDLEWLGVGRVRAFMVINGIPVWFHEFDNANNLTSVYMSNPNLPMRWELEATGAITGTATMEAICASMNSEGGYEITGVTASVDMGSTVESVPGNGFEELLAIRMRSSFTEFATAFLQRGSVLAASASSFLWRIVLNPTETAAGTWVNVNTGSSIMEYNLGRTVTENTGLLIACGYTATASNQASVDDRPVLTLGTTLAGVTDVLSLQVRNLAAGNEDYLGSLTWREIF
jgi:hypothetical protein